MTSTPPPRTHDDPYAPFRPRWGFRVPRVMAIVVFVAAAVGGATIPGTAWSIVDRLFFFALGAMIAGLLWRYSRIEAKPSKQGLVVRNLFLTRRLTWEEIVRMQFGGGAPWVSLDLADTDTVAVMAIQKADGAHGRALAARLAALIEFHGDLDLPPTTKV